MTERWASYYSSPIGKIVIESDGENLVGLWFEGQRHFDASLGAEVDDDLPVFAETRRWLDIYFSGNDPDFMPPVSFHGTPFQESVWKILQTIPYGKTLTYGEIASRLAQEKNLQQMSAQAVGGAVGRNPISIIVPCHRVLGAKGKMTGYAGGIWRKEFLLELERGKSYPAFASS